MYDFQLDQFGIRRDDNETFAQALDRVLRSDFLSHNDNAFLDLTIDKSLEINKGIAIQPNVYYFSYAATRPRPIRSPATTTHRVGHPSNGMCALMMPGSVNMGKYYDKYTAGGIYIDQSWLPNDGLVNTVSALYPTTTDKNTTECLKRDGTQAGSTMTAIPTSPSGPASGTSCPSRAPTICSLSAASPTRASSRRTCSTAT